MTSSSDHDGEALSAYLAGDLDDAEAAVLEERLAAEPELAGRLEEIHRMLVALQGLDEVEPPAGYATRLRARLDADQPVVELAPRRRRVSWPAVAAAAAGVAVVGVAAVVIGPFAPDTPVFDLAEPDAEVAEEAPDEDVFDAETQMLTREDRVAEPDVEDPAADTDVLDQPAAPSAAGPEPVLLDEEALLPDEEAVRTRYAALPEAEALLGMALDDAEAHAVSFRFAVQRAAPFASGVHPADCLDVTTTATDAPVVIARAESAIHGTDAAIAYVAVTTPPGSEALDRVEVWVVDAATCATRLYIAL